MESFRDLIRVKKEPNEILPDVDDDYNFNSMDSYQVKNFEAPPVFKTSENQMNENIALQKKLDAKISIEFECKDVKVEPTPQSTAICKSELQNFQPIIVKMENENQINDVNENIFIDLECKNVKFEQKTIHKTEYQCNLPIVKVENQFQMNLDRKTYLVYMILLQGFQV
ncbi:uncharacterized protein LOC106658863 isoform X1 [Trichogramma pretiosum]|uniref:uncharacterized protein LOC106658863 isoform X1 n=1 Tax=Trichogramma pretiosum TaxID=7493 RepID=UPI0006C955E6|nr:uncharacterized protein LOC106658863 isoform X1 [Trichogramma pretiosum]